MKMEDRIMLTLETAISICQYSPYLLRDRQLIELRRWPNDEQQSESLDIL